MVEQKMESLGPRGNHWATTQNPEILTSNKVNNTINA